MKKRSRMSRQREAMRQKAGPQGLRVNNWTSKDFPDTPEYEPRVGPLIARPLPNVAARDQSTINWPYPPASFQTFAMTGWTGNQLPGTHLKPWQDGYIPIWWHTATQEQNHHYRGSNFGKQLGQVESHNILQAISQAWQNIRGG